MNALVILVLYKQKLEESLTYQSLLSSCNQLQLPLPQLVIYDNSPNRLVPSSLADSIIYYHNQNNGGTCAAYNYGYQVASQLQREWIILLDQDTLITPDYLTKLICTLQKIPANISAVIPKIISGNRQISPTKSLTLHFDRHPLKSGNYKKNLTAIASGSAIRRSSLKDSNGFNPIFPLDYLDHWLFYELTTRSHEIIVLETTLKHNLSVDSIGTLSVERYKQILIAESLFYHKYERSLLLKYKIHLVFRFLKQFSFAKTRRFAAITWHIFWKYCPPNSSKHS